MSLSAFLEQPQKKFTVLIIPEYRLSSMPSIVNMIGNIFYKYSWEARHADFLWRLWMGCMILTHQSRHNSRLNGNLPLLTIPAISAGI